MIKKDLVIIIPGAKFVGSKNGNLQKTILFFYRLVRTFKPVYYNYAKAWAKSFKKASTDTFWLHWSRGITPLSRWFAVKRLNYIIQHYSKTHNVKIVGISLGGEIALETLKRFDTSKIKKLILVCSTNEQATGPRSNIPVINIYSENDLFAKFVIKILAPFHGGQKLLGTNIKNVILPDMTHDEFCSNAKIKSGKFKGLKVTDVINKCLK
jgi:hypothetical protein